MGGVDAGVGVAHREVGVDGLVYGVTDVLEQFPVWGHLTCESPRVGEDPGAGVHGDVKVRIGDPLRHVVGIVARLGFAERPVSARRLLGRPVVVVVAVEVDLVHVPATVGVVAIRIEQNHDMEFCVLQHFDGLRITIDPTLDVELRCQEGELCAQVLVAVVTSIDVHLLLRRAIGLGVVCPVADLHNPLLPSMDGRSRCGQEHDLRIVTSP